MSHLSPARGLIALGLLGFLPLTVAAADAPKPNVLYIVADDLGYADLGCQGSKDIATPNIDSLAKDGVRFTNGYVTCPYCSPTRAGLLTGKYQTRFGHEFNPALVSAGGAGQGLPVGEKTIADRLRAAGYRTALIGKWHQGEEEKFHPLSRGFDEFFGFLPGAHSYLKSQEGNWGPIFRGREKVELKGYLTDVLGDETAAFIDRNRANPWFVYLAFNAVHTPMEAPAAEEAKFASEKDPKRRTYLAMLARLDAAVGAVLAKIKETGAEKNTLVIFHSDNGGPTTKFSPNGSRNGPLKGSKGDMWEGGIRVPFLVKWPEAIRPGVHDETVISLDATATALRAAGAATDGLDGVDLLPYLEGTKLPKPALYWRFGPQMAMRMGEWKLVKATRSPDVHYLDTPESPMLFNLKEDIGETTDLADKFPERVREMQELWDEWNKKNAAPAWPATLMGKPLKLK